MREHVNAALTMSDVTTDAPVDPSEADGVVRCQVYVG